jgi:hypothetical protein
LRAVREQQFHHLRLQLRTGPHQGRLPRPAFLGVDVGTGVDQQLGCVDLTRPHDEHQRRFALGIRRVGIDARRQQLADHRLRADQSGLRHRRHAEDVLSRRIAPRADQAIDDDGVVIACRPHQRRGAERIRGIHIHAILDEPDDGLAIACTNGVRERVRKGPAAGASQ